MVVAGSFYTDARESLALVEVGKRPCGFEWNTELGRHFPGHFGVSSHMRLVLFWWFLHLRVHFRWVLTDQAGSICLWNMSSSIDIFWFHAVHAYAFAMARQYIFVHSCAYANYYARLCQCFKCQNRADDDGNDGSCADAALFMPFYDILCLLNSQLTFATVADLDSMGRVPCFARPGL